MRNAHGDPQSLLVLGASSDIAQAITRQLVSRRVRTVVLASRHPDDLTALVAALRGLGATTVETVAFDATATGEHEAVIGAAFERHGDLDVVLIAFGVLGDQTAFDRDPGAAVAAATTNYVGTVSAGLIVAERFRRQGHGLLVILSSVAGRRVRKANFVYGSAKAGVDGFALGLGDALEGTGAKVLVVRPGFVVTKMTAGMTAAPLSSTPERVADAVVAAVLSGREVVWVPSALRPMFMVLGAMPRRLWRRLPM